MDTIALRLDEVYYDRLPRQLSGGMDSSVISYLAAELSKEKFGGGARLKTFAIGVGESDDIQNARISARHGTPDCKGLEGYGTRVSNPVAAISEGFKTGVS